MDGPWQTCANTAAEYGRIAQEAAKIMRWVDPSIELTACGSSGRNMETFGAWEKTVLEHRFNEVDWIPLHTYTNNYADDTPAFLASPDLMESFIEEVVAIADSVAARRRSRKRIKLNFDEWNVRYRTRGRREARTRPGWPIAPPIMTETGGPCWRQTIFWPFAQFSNHGRGRVLRTLLESESYATAYQDPRGWNDPPIPLPAVPYVKLAAVETDTGGLNLFVLNRSLDQEAQLDVAPRGFGTCARSRRCHSTTLIFTPRI